MRFVKDNPWTAATIVFFGTFWIVSATTGFEPGEAIGRSFASFLFDMLKILPCVFILIGLFSVWAKKDAVERYLGYRSGPSSYVWAVLLAAITVGGLHVAFPIAHALHTKGAKLGVVLTYLSASSICRIPMTFFEASFLGWPFTGVRFAISLPLVILFSAIVGSRFDARQYRLPDVEGAEGGRF